MRYFVHCALTAYECHRRDCYGCEVSNHTPFEDVAIKQASWKVFSMPKYESIHVRTLQRYVQWISMKKVHLFTYKNHCIVWCCCTHVTVVVAIALNVSTFWIIVFADQIEILFNYYIRYSFYNYFCLSLSLTLFFHVFIWSLNVTEWKRKLHLYMGHTTLRSCILWKNGFAWRRGIACNEYKFHLVANSINTHM